MTEARPTKPQRAAILFALVTNEGVLFPSTVRRDVLNRIVAAGWATPGQPTGRRDDNGELWEEYPQITDAGKLAVQRADLIALPDVVPGDVLVYRTHPGCAVRVTEVKGGGRLFAATYITLCGVCDGRDNRGETTGYAPRRVGEVFDHPAYLLRPAYPTDVRTEAFTDADRHASIASERYKDPATGRAGWTSTDRRTAAEYAHAPAATVNHERDGIMARAIRAVGTGAARRVIEQHDAGHARIATVPAPHPQVVVAQLDWAREVLAAYRREPERAAVFALGYMSGVVLDLIEGKAPSVADKAYALYVVWGELNDSRGGGAPTERYEFARLVHPAPITDPALADHRPADGVW